MIFLLCSGCRKFFDLIQIPIVSSNIAALETSIDGSIFLLVLLVLFINISKNLLLSFLKAGAKVRALFLTTKLFRKFFLFYLFTHFSGSLCERERMYKRKTKAVFFANRTAKIRTFSDNLQTFFEVFLFLFSDALIL